MLQHKTFFICMLIIIFIFSDAYAKNKNNNSFRCMPRKNKIVVVIDAGHGGKDPGTIGILKTKEKDVVLSIAMKLATLMNQCPKMHAVLTRNGDYFVPLRNRLRLARKGKADLFVAIHADSYFDKKSNGVSIYAVSKRGATSEAARWLAKRENYSELGGVNLNAIKESNPVLKNVLFELSQKATVRDSLRLGTQVLKAFERTTSLHHHYIEQAPFLVLRSPDIPSILVETGFLSNKQEEIRLRTDAYQKKIAVSLFNGINQYIKNYPLSF